MADEDPHTSLNILIARGHALCSKGRYDTDEEGSHGAGPKFYLKVEAAASAPLKQKPRHPS